MPPPRDDVSDPEWSWKYEQQYGAPGLKDRETVLQTALNVLLDGSKRDVRSIVAVLHKIKRIALENAVLGATLNRQREDAEEVDKIRRALTKWLARAVQLHQRSNPDDLPSGLRFRRMYEAMLTALTFDEPMTDHERTLRDWLFFPRSAAMVRRRKTPGNPDAVLVKEAHRLLSDVKVPRKHHGDLLWAIGLLDEKGNLHPRGIFSRE